MDDPFVLAGREHRSRLIVGTGTYRSFAETRQAVEASGAEIVTVAVRRVNITDPGKENLLDFLPPDRFTILPTRPAATAPRRRSAPAGSRAKRGSVRSSSSR